MKFAVGFFIITRVTGGSIEVSEVQFCGVLLKSTGLIFVDSISSKSTANVSKLHCQNVADFVKKVY